MNLQTPFNPTINATAFVGKNRLDATANTIINAPDSVIVQCQDETLLAKCIVPLTEQNVDIAIINLQNIKHSYHYNPLNHLDIANIDHVKALARAIVYDDYSSASSSQAMIDLVTFAINYLFEFLPEPDRNLTQLFKMISLFNDIDECDDQSMGDKLMEMAIRKNPHAVSVECWNTWKIAYSKQERLEAIQRVVQHLQWVEQGAWKDLVSTAYKAKRHKGTGFIWEYSRDKTNNYIVENENIDLFNKRTILFIIDDLPDILTAPIQVMFKQLLLQTIYVNSAYAQSRDMLWIVEQEKTIYSIPQNDWKKYQPYKRDFMHYYEIPEIKYHEKIRQYDHEATKYIKNLQLYLTTKYTTRHYCEESVEIKRDKPRRSKSAILSRADLAKALNIDEDKLNEAIEQSMVATERFDSDPDIDVAWFLVR